MIFEKLWTYPVIALEAFNYDLNIDYYIVVGTILKLGVRLVIPVF